LSLYKYRVPSGPWAEIWELQEIHVNRKGEKGRSKGVNRKRAPRAHRAPLTSRGGNRQHPPARRPPKSQIKTPHRRRQGSIASEQSRGPPSQVIPLIPFTIPSSALLSPFVDRFWMSEQTPTFFSHACVSRRTPPSARRARSHGSSLNPRCCCGNGVGRTSFTRTEVLASCGARPR
jgi:hypothetical protein